jgi:hypothetical protein
MNSLNDLTYLDALLYMCLHYQQLKADDPSDPALRDALMCIQDCERRQLRLQHHG